jgi:hypothetical protein
MPTLAGSKQQMSTLSELTPSGQNNPRINQYSKIMKKRTDFDRDESPADLNVAEFVAGGRGSPQARTAEAPEGLLLSKSRKGHHKSRQGCLNCKRRKVKVFSHPFPKTGHLAYYFKVPRNPPLMLKLHQTEPFVLISNSQNSGGSKTIKAVRKLST